MTPDVIIPAPALASLNLAAAKLRIAAEKKQRRWYCVRIEVQPQEWAVVLDFTEASGADDFNATIRNIIQEFRPRRMAIEIVHARAPNAASRSPQQFLICFDQEAEKEEPPAEFSSSSPATANMYGKEEIEELFKEREQAIRLSGQIERYKTEADRISFQHAKELSDRDAAINALQDELDAARETSDKLKAAVEKWRTRAINQRLRADVLEEMNENTPGPLSLEGVIHKIEGVADKASDPALQPIIEKGLGLVSTIVQAIRGGASPALAGATPPPPPPFKDMRAMLVGNAFDTFPPELRADFLQLIVALDLEPRIIDDLIQTAYADLTAMGYDYRRRIEEVNSDPVLVENRWNIPEPVIHTSQAAQPAYAPPAQPQQPPQPSRFTQPPPVYAPPAQAQQPPQPPQPQDYAQPPAPPQGDEPWRPPGAPQTTPKPTATIYSAPDAWDDGPSSSAWDDSPTLQFNAHGPDEEQRRAAGGE